MRRRGADVVDRRRDAGGGRGRVEAAVLRASGLHRAVRVCAVEVHQGSAWPGNRRRQEIVVNSELTCGGAPVGK